jgi:hypothetical protein
MTLTLTQLHTMTHVGVAPKAWPTVDMSRLSEGRLFYQPCSSFSDHQENRIAGPTVSLPREGKYLSPPA